MQQIINASLILLLLLTEKCPIYLNCDGLSSYISILTNGDVQIDGTAHQKSTLKGGGWSRSTDWHITLNTDCKYS